MALVEVDATAPDFTLEDLGGKEVTLTNVLVLYPVLLVLFRSDCPLCQWALPQLARYRDWFRGGDIEILGMTPDPALVARATIEAHRIDIPVLLDKGGAVAEAYGVSELPAAVFIAPDGAVVDVVEGWDPHGYTRIGRRIKEQLNWIRGPEFGIEWDGDPCPARSSPE